MTPETRKRLINSLSCCYNTIGYDAWGAKEPEEANFVDVLCDQIRTHVSHCEYCKATKADADEFYKLTEKEQEDMCLEVGP